MTRPSETIREQVQRQSSIAANYPSIEREAVKRQLAQVTAKLTDIATRANNVVDPKGFGKRQFMLRDGVSECYRSRRGFEKVFANLQREWNSYWPVFQHLNAKLKEMNHDESRYN